MLIGEKIKKAYEAVLISLFFILMMYVLSVAYTSFGKMPKLPILIFVIILFFLALFLFPVLVVKFNEKWGVKNGE